MSDHDIELKRGWCVDYAFRVQPKEAVVTPEKIIQDAKKFERYLFGIQKPTVMKLVNPKNK